MNENENIIITFLIDKQSVWQSISAVTRQIDVVRKKGYIKRQLNKSSNRQEINFDENSDLSISSSRL